MKLEPFSHQVTGHAFLLTTEDKMTICKVMNRNELNFYLNMDPDFQPFTPEFRGLVDVTVLSEGDGQYEFVAHFQDKLKERCNCTSLSDDGNRQDERNQEFRKDKHNQLTPVKYRGLDPSKFHEIPGFRSHQFTKDVKFERPAVISDIGRNPWVQRLQRMGRHKSYHGNTIPYILLENLGGSFEKPCILDLKMGIQAYGKDCSERKLRHHLEKDKLTTTSSIGIRLTGLQVYHEGAYICRDKFYGRGLSSAGLKETFRMFFSDGTKLQTRIMDSIISKVKAIHSVVSELHSYRLYGTSMVIFYEGGECCSEDYDCFKNDAIKESCQHCRTDVRVVDFARSMLTSKRGDNMKQEGPDGEFLMGLNNFLKMLDEIKREGA